MRRMVTPTLNKTVMTGFAEYPILIRHDAARKSPITGFQYQPGIECHITHRGRGAFYLGDELYVQEERHIVLFSGDIPHQVFADTMSGYKRSVVCFDQCVSDWYVPKGSVSQSPLLLPKRSEGYVLRIPDPKWPRVNDLIERVSYQFVHQDAGWDNVVTEGVLELLSIVLEYGTDTSLTELESLPGRCIRLIKDHLEEDLSVKMLADLLYISHKHLSRTFSSTVGMTITSYILHERIKRAKHLLRNDKNLTMSGVALRTGFKSLSHFSSAFKRITGVTPSVFRSSP